MTNNTNANAVSEASNITTTTCKLVNISISQTRLKASRLHVIDGT